MSDKLALTATWTFLIVVTVGINVAQPAFGKQLESKKIHNPEFFLNSSHNSREFLIARKICTSYRVTRKAGLYVYNGDKIIRTLPYNSIVEVIGLSENKVWAEIKYTYEFLGIEIESQGWVKQEYLSCYQR